MQNKIILKKNPKIYDNETHTCILIFLNVKTYLKYIPEKNSGNIL